MLIHTSRLVLTSVCGSNRTIICNCCASPRHPLRFSFIGWFTVRKRAFSRPRFLPAFSNTLSFRLLYWTTLRARACDVVYSLRAEQASHVWVWSGRRCGISSGSLSRAVHAAQRTSLGECAQTNTLLGCVINARDAVGRCSSSLIVPFFRGFDAEYTAILEHMSYSGVQQHRTLFINVVQFS